jgi:UDP-N-acetylglucosamine transferase subunit ALG13
VRILFSSLSVRSHLLPTLPLAGALRDSGCEVTYATGPDAVGWVRSHGLEAVPAGLTREKFMQLYSARYSEEIAGLDPDARLAHLLLYGLVGISAPAAARDMLPLVAAWRPQVVVGTMADWASEVAAASVGAAHVVHGFGPPKGDGLRDRLFAALDSVHAECGVEPRPLSERVSDIYLDIWPPSLSSSTGDLSYPCAWLLRPQDVMPTDAARLAEAGGGHGVAATVYVTAGTTYTTPAGLLETIVEALRDAPVRAVVTVGPDGDPNRFGRLPDHIRVERFVPQAELLPHCDAVICHGGAGTTLGALAHGVPLVIVPVASDHHEVAESTVSAGCALALPLASSTPASVAASLEAVLADPGYRASAGAVASEMAAMTGPAEVAARLIDQFA